jgi:hypothetical protein
MTHPDQPEAWRIEPMDRLEIEHVVRELLVAHGVGAYPNQAINGPLEREAINRLIRIVTNVHLAASKGEGEGAPEGWVLVPKEPSDAMIRAALDAHAENAPYETPFGPDGSFAHHYRAMLAASPSPPETAGS